MAKNSYLGAHSISHMSVKATASTHVWTSIRGSYHDDVKAGRLSSAVARHSRYKRLDEHMERVTCGYEPYVDRRSNWPRFK